MAILDGHDVVEPVAVQSDRVTGAQVVNRDTGAEWVLDAKLVVDAMGRGARTPAFLESLGYGRPITEHSTANASYSSQLLRVPAGVINEKMTLTFPEPNLPTGGNLSSYEDDTWMLTVFRLGQHEPPADLAGLIALGAQFVSPAPPTALQAGELSVRLNSSATQAASGDDMTRCSDFRRGCWCSATRSVVSIPFTPKG